MSFCSTNRPLVTPKAPAKHAYYLQQTEAGLLIKSSCLAPSLGVTKFIIGIDVNLATLYYAT
jgi:hypothetical protein